MPNQPDTSQRTYDNLIVVTVECVEHAGQDERHFCYEDIAPSQAVHRALIDVPCTGSFSIAVTVIEGSDMIAVQSSNTN